MRKTYLQTPRCNKSSEQKQPQFWVLHLQYCNSTAILSLLTHPWAFVGGEVASSLVPIKTPKNADLKQNIPYSSSKNELRISSEKQFRVCNHGDPSPSSCTARKGEHFHRGRERGWTGYSKQWVCVFFISWILGRKEKEYFLFLLVSSTVTGCESSCFCSPDPAEVSTH